MIKPYPIPLRLTGLALSFLVWAHPAYALDPAGHLLFVHGTVTVSGADGKTRTGTRGGSVYPKEKVTTAAASSAQIKMTDGGMMALRPGSEFRIENYHHNPANPKSEKQETSLVKGSLRAITGAIGKRVPENVNFKTPVATMGIRGTVVQLVYIPSGGLPEFPGVMPGLYAMVEQGRAELSNTSGAIPVTAGGVAYVQNQQTRPQASPQNIQLFQEANRTTQSQQQTSSTSTTTASNTDSTGSTTTVPSETVVSTPQTSTTSSTATQSTSFVLIPVSSLASSSVISNEVAPTVTTTTNNPTASSTTATGIEWTYSEVPVHTKTFNLTTSSNTAANGLPSISVADSSGNTIQTSLTGSTSLSNGTRSIQFYLGTYSDIETTIPFIVSTAPIFDWNSVSSVLSQNNYGTRTYYVNQTAGFSSNIALDKSPSRIMIDFNAQKIGAYLSFNQNTQNAFTVTGQESLSNFYSSMPLVHSNGNTAAGSITGQFAGLSKTLHGLMTILQIIDPSGSNTATGSALWTYGSKSAVLVSSANPASVSDTIESHPTVWGSYGSYAASGFFNTTAYTDSWTTANTTINHYIEASIPTTLPTSGSMVFNLASPINLTDSSGTNTVATIEPRSAIKLDFGNNRISTFLEITPASSQTELLYGNSNLTNGYAWVSLLPASASNTYSYGSSLATRATGSRTVDSAISSLTLSSSSSSAYGVGFWVKDTNPSANWSSSLNTSQITTPNDVVWGYWSGRQSSDSSNTSGLLLNGLISTEGNHTTFIQSELPETTTAQLSSLGTTGSFTYTLAGGGTLLNNLGNSVSLNGNNSAVGNSSTVQLNLSTQTLEARLNVGSDTFTLPATSLATAKSLSGAALTYSGTNYLTSGHTFRGMVVGPSAEGVLSLIKLQKDATTAFQGAAVFKR